MQIYWILATVGLVFLILEIFLGTQFFLFFLASALLLATGIGVLFSLSMEAILWIFSGISLILMIVWHRFFRFRYTNQDVNNPLSAIKGSVGVIIQGDEPSSLKIKIGHTLWTAKSAENTTYAKGSKVVVLSVEGVKLIVQAAHKE